MSSAHATAPLGQPAQHSPVAYAHDPTYKEGNTFLLPNDLQTITKHSHRSPPTHLPSNESTVDDVKYFLYQILTLKSSKLAKRSPEYIWQTVHNWDSPGMVFRALNEKGYRNICPYWYHCADGFQRAIGPEYRTLIGDVIWEHVSRLEQMAQKLRHRVEQSTKAKQDWERMSKGSRPYLSRSMSNLRSVTPSISIPSLRTESPAIPRSMISSSIRSTTPKPQQPSFHSKPSRMGSFRQFFSPRQSRQQDSESFTKSSLSTSFKPSIQSSVMPDSFSCRTPPSSIIPPKSPALPERRAFSLRPKLPPLNVNIKPFGADTHVRWADDSKPRIPQSPGISPTDPSPYQRPTTSQSRSNGPDRYRETILKSARYPPPESKRPYPPDSSLHINQSAHQTMAELRGPLTVRNKTSRQDSEEESSMYVHSARGLRYVPRIDNLRNCYATEIQRERQSPQFDERNATTRTRTPQPETPLPKVQEERIMPPNHPTEQVAPSASTYMHPQLDRGREDSAYCLPPAISPAPYFQPHAAQSLPNPQETMYIQQPPLNLWSGGGNSPLYQQNNYYNHPPSSPAPSEASTMPRLQGGPQVCWPNRNADYNRPDKRSQGRATPILRSERANAPTKTLSRSKSRGNLSYEYGFRHAKSPELPRLRLRDEEGNQFKPLIDQIPKPKTPKQFCR